MPLERIVVVHDELDLPFGSLRLKRGGSDGGHNGLRSTTAALGTNQYPRVRFGIGRPPGRQDPADYVLKEFARPSARSWRSSSTGRPTPSKCWSRRAWTPRRTSSTTEPASLSDVSPW